MLVIYFEVLGFVDEHVADATSLTPRAATATPALVFGARSYRASHVSTNRLRLAQSLLSLSIKPSIAVK
jgi:hypothetical protein